MIRFNTRPFGQLMMLLCVLTLAACGGGGGDSPEPAGESTNQPDDGGNTDEPDNDDGSNMIVDVSDPNQCNVATQRQWAYNSMLDFYLFYDQVPVVDPQSFDDADDVVRSVRFQERDDFSRVDDAEESALAFDEGREFGLGFRWRFDNDDNARIVLVADDSPFGRAGIERGDIIVAVDGLAWSDEALGVNFSERVVGTPDNPSTATWTFQKRDTQESLTVDLTATEYNINTVLEAATYTGGSIVGAVGYLAFSRFLNTSENELNAVFSDFQDRNITELVLDLRYNGGGRVFIARQLASLIAGNSNAGKTIYDYRFNDKYTEENYTLELQPNVGDLGLSRVIILTTDRTASASEIVVAGLQPHMEVVTIGTRTTGKPYVQFAYDRCGERLAVIEAEGFNADGVSVFGGVPALCFAEDDPTRDYGLSDDGEFEGFLRAGIDFIETGACATEPVFASRTITNRTAFDADEESQQGMSLRGGALAN